MNPASLANEPGLYKVLSLLSSTRFYLSCPLQGSISPVLYKVLSLLCPLTPPRVLYPALSPPIFCPPSILWAASGPASLSILRLKVWADPPQPPSSSSSVSPPLLSTPATGGTMVTTPLTTTGLSIGPRWATACRGEIEPTSLYRWLNIVLLYK